MMTIWRKLIWKFELGPCRVILTKRPWQPHHHHLLLQEPKVNRGALQCPARLVFDNWKQCRRNIFKYKDKSVIKQLQKTQLTFFSKSWMRSSTLDWTSQMGRDCGWQGTWKGFFTSVWTFFMVHSCVRKSWFLDSAFYCVFHCRCAIKSLKILSNREFYYPPHIALSGNYYPRFQIIKIFKFIVTSFSFEESKLWTVPGTKHKATLRQALPMWPT